MCVCVCVTNLSDGFCFKKVEQILHKPQNVLYVLVSASLLRPASDWITHRTEAYDE